MSTQMDENQMTENDLKREIARLETIMGKGDGTAAMALRLDRMRRAYESIRSVKFGGRW